MKTLLDSKLLVFTAHPDDESYTCAGTLYKNGKNGGKVVLVCATLGEKGNVFIKKSVTETRLRNVRKKELMRSAKFLGLSKVLVLGMCDGEVSGYQNRIFTAGMRIAKRYHPDFILSFGPDGFSGHKDHIAVGRAARVIAKKINVPFVAFSIPPEFKETARRYLESRRKSPVYKNAKLARPNLRIKINPAIKAKSLRIYSSQKGIGDNPFARLEYECFVRK